MLEKYKEKIGNFKNIDILHILVIISSIICLGIGLFNKNIWFDEAYSVGLINHNIFEMCKIAAYDVHPILYYIILKIFTIIFGSSMIVYRITSLVPMIILLIFGYTHIRKEFGKKIGIYFTFLTGFMPIIVNYSTQIRMYTWAILFVTLTGFYAYKIVKLMNKKSFILFSIFSVLSAYTHYYALFTIVVINLLLLFYILKNKKENLKKWLIFGIIQIIAYIPGIIVFFMQYFKVAQGFWITIKYPNILFEIINSYFKSSSNNIFSMIFSILFFVYISIKTFKMYKENKRDTMNIIIPIIICAFVIIFALIASLISPVFITRYMLPMLGLFIFSISNILAKENKLFLKLLIILSIIFLSIYNGYLLYEKCYDERNNYIKEEISSQLQENDIFVFTNINAGTILSTYFPNNKYYFFNKEKWDIKDAYKAFSPQMECIESLDKIKDYSGRIWVIDFEDSNIYQDIEKIETKNILINKGKIYNPYAESTFVITLFQNN